MQLLRNFPIAVLLVGFFGTARGESPEGWEDPRQIKTGAPAPEKMPDKIFIPPNVSVTIKAGRIGEKPVGATPQQERDRLMWDPDLVTAVIRRDSDAVLGEYLWEGEARTSAFQRDGVTFRQGALEYPNDIIVSNDAGALTLFLTRQGFVEGKVQAGFPGLDWYSPQAFAGTAKLRGKNVLLFSAGKLPPAEASMNSAESTPTPSVAGGAEAEDVGQAGESAANPLLSNYALLDPATFLPLQLFDGEFQYVFSYARNASPVEPPKVLAKKVGDYFASQEKKKTDPRKN